MQSTATSKRERGLTIVIYGSDLAALLAAAILDRRLSLDYQIVQVLPVGALADLPFYGGTTGPSGYDLFRAAGLEEPDLLLHTTSTFSLGSWFRSWPTGSADWVQCFSQPFQVLDDCAFDQVAAYQNLALQDLLIAAQAARHGKFAHPPGDRNNPLSRAEYGYQFSASDLAECLRSRRGSPRLLRIEAGLLEPRLSGDTIVSLLLDDGQQVAGDLFIDGSGSARALRGALSSDFASDRQVCVAVERQAQDRAGLPCCTIGASSEGWSVEVALQNRAEVLRFADPDGAATDDRQAWSQPVDIGALTKAWQGNCLALGNAAAVFEPLSPAPMTLMWRALMRLSELIPYSDDMAMECREFNRRFREDVLNAEAFHRALFLDLDAPASPYWQKATDQPVGDRLRHKIEQFTSRGLLVQYDFEPFHSEDWAILHYGMGRRPDRHDPRLAHLRGSDQTLDLMHRAISSLVGQMPPHHEYVTRFKSYLEKKQHAGV